MWGSRGACSARHAPAQEAEPIGALVLVGAREEQLHPQAQADQRHAGAGALAQQLVQPGGPQPPHRLGKRADAGQHEPGCLAQRGVIGRHRDRRADVLQRLLDRAAVAHPVVDDGGRTSLGASQGRVPFVEGTTPSVPGTTATAVRSARAKALNAASIMWWALSPACRSRWSGQPRRAGDGTEELGRHVVLEAGDVAAAEPLEAAAHRQRTAGHVKRAERPRLVHRHDRVPVAGDPGAVAERLVERLAEHDPGVLDRVVGAGLDVTGRAHVEIEAAVTSQQVEHVVEEADAGGCACRRRCRPARRSA